jgi:exopolyphosphatase/guanosine-5'-triphosphate,3'-diphosphate pyrophosphatase
MTAPLQSPAELVAIDLGSNSFHMVIAHLVGGQLHLIDRLRERVALAAGLDDDTKQLDPDAVARALDCLERFGQRLRPMKSPSVRAVGTNTLRRARNAREFIESAEQALGFPIEVISGAEEARLVYLGVSHALADETGRRLVVDIGGGSTECILGERFEAFRTESLHMGCVSHTQRFFPGGIVTRANFREAVTAAQVELEPIKLDYRRTGWVEAVGSSGTIAAIDEIMRANGWGGDGITRDGLRALRDRLIELGWPKKETLPGMSADRVPVLAGGLAILYALFKSLRVERMVASTYALREGLLYDTLGGIKPEGVRNRTIDRLIHRYHVDEEQADRVGATAVSLFDQVTTAWSLHHPELRWLLSWAARLHELGLVVSFSGFHTHGAYILTHSDMPGFSRDQQAYLAALVAGHRRRLKPERITALRDAGGEEAIRLAAILRLAATLNRSRDDSPLPELSLTAAGQALELTLPDEWLDRHKMTRADLENQARYLAEVGLHFTAR